MQVENIQTLVSNNNKHNNYYYYQVLSSIKQVLKMLTTKNYKISPSPSQEKLNLNYEAAGQLSDQKSHRFFRFGLKLHLSVENLNSCDNNQIQNQSHNQIQNHHQHQNQLTQHPLQSYYSSLNGQSALGYPPITATKTSGSASPPSSMPSSWTDSYLKGTQPHYFSRSPTHSIASSTRSSSSTSSRSGENGLHELTLDTSGLEKRWNKRVAQLGNHLSNIRLRMPDKVKGLIDNGRDYARSHPLTFVTLVALLLSCSVPVVAFLIFAMSTVAVTFVGFLFVEGTILTVASVALTTTLLLVAFTTLTLTSLFMLAYMILNAGVKLVTGSPLTPTNPINAFMQFLSPSSPESSSIGHDDEDDDHDVHFEELSSSEYEGTDAETVVIADEDEDDDALLSSTTTTST